jgi:HEAT repeat protein
VLDLPALAPAAQPPPLDPGPAGAARFIFDELERCPFKGQRALDLAGRAVGSLQALGEPGLAAARAGLASAKLCPLLAAAQLLLRAGGSEDRGAVLQRLSRELPAEAAGPLLAELLERDPVQASPGVLVALLEHDTPAMRSAARLELEKRLSPALVPLLSERCSSRRAQTRLFALELAARIEDPSAQHLLASRLGDESSLVASRAAALLAAAPAVEGLLLERAFPESAAPAPEEPGAGSAGSAWNRARAYALLALIEREEARGTALLDGARVEALLGGLGDAPIVSGACAIALARIGYRSAALGSGAGGGSGWLDREVPHLLVRYGTGAVFHRDFSALQRPALRALALLSGESLPDSEAWRQWWLANAEGFRARRAVIEASAEDAGSLVVEFQDGESGRWALLGPEVAWPADGGPHVRLSEQAALRLLGFLRSAGILGVERPPARCSPDPGQRIVRVAIGAHEKRLSAPSGAAAPWFEQLFAELEGLVGANRWQLLYDRTRYGSQQEWWQAAHVRWDEELQPLERSRELKSLVLAALLRAEPGQQDLLEDLERLYAEPGVPEGADLQPLCTLLVRVGLSGPQGERLLELARVAAALADGAPAPEAFPETGAHTAPSAAERLLGLALELDDGAGCPALGQLIARLSPATQRALARDERAAVRALAARGLGRSSAPEDRALLLALLQDEDRQVELAALAVLAENPDPEARQALAERAREGDPERRAAALVALGALGGDPGLDMALLAIADADAQIQLAGVEALAALADPRGASLLASLFARGPASPLFAPARRGLERLGPAGIDECLRLARSASPRTRREAALFLSEAGRGEAAGLLLTLLTEEPQDERVAWELAVLSALDLRESADPVAGWWQWWDLVVHDDPLAWFLAAAEREGFSAPVRESLEGAGSPEGLRFLLGLLACERAHLVERAARELERRLGRRFARPGAQAEERAVWVAELEEAVLAGSGR